MPPVEWALRWLFGIPQVTTILSGAPPRWSRWPRTSPSSTASCARWAASRGGRGRRAHDARRRAALHRSPLLHEPPPAGTRHPASAGSTNEHKLTKGAYLDGGRGAARGQAARLLHRLQLRGGLPPSRSTSPRRFRLRRCSKRRFRRFSRLPDSVDTLRDAPAGTAGVWAGPAMKVNGCSAERRKTCAARARCMPARGLKPLGRTGKSSPRGFPRLSDAHRARSLTYAQPARSSEGGGRFTPPSPRGAPPPPARRWCPARLRRRNPRPCPHRTGSRTTDLSAAWRKRGCRTSWTRPRPAGRRR